MKSEIPPPKPRICRAPALGFHPLSDLFPLLEGSAFDNMVEDIRTSGLHEPIWMYEGQILDGRNRYRACREAGVTPAFREFEGTDPLAFILSMNLERRHLSKGQLAFVALAIERVEAERAKQRQGARTDILAIVPESERGNARDKAANRVGVSPRYVQDAKTLERTNPELAQQVKHGIKTLPQAMRRLQGITDAANLARPVAIDLPEGIYHGDFRKLSKQIPDNSVDLIFTDPPYDHGSVPLYAEAAEVAARILKPGGSIVAYAGHMYLPDVIAGLSQHLNYLWTLAIVHEGCDDFIKSFGIRVGWRSLLWYVKGRRGNTSEIVKDTFHSPNKEKELHPWQQTEAEAAYYIEKLCAPGGLVVDFFLGSGTTGAAARRLGRRFIGFEINASTIEIATKRINRIKETFLLAA